MLPQWLANAALLCMCILSTRALHCPWGQFRLPSMGACQPWLRCDAMAELPIGDLLGFGAVKMLYESEWQGRPVALAFLNNPDYLQDFLTGLHNLKALAVYPGKVVQLIGFCEPSSVYVTELEPFKDATNFNRFLHSLPFQSIVEEMSTRFRFCIKYVEILATLHEFPLGPMVMCDSNTLEKTLQQYLLSEQHLLLLGDTDALPVVLKKQAEREARRSRGDVRNIQLYSCARQCANERVCLNPASSERAFRSFFMCLSNQRRYVLGLDKSGGNEESFPVPGGGGLTDTVAAPEEYSAILEAMPRGEDGIRCGSKPLTGEFVAPEQRREQPASLSCRVGSVSEGEDSLCEAGKVTTPGLSDMEMAEQNVYDEATDVFKIPNVCEHFLGEGSGAVIIKAKLSDIHTKCKSDLPRNRPTAGQVLKVYTNLNVRLDALLQRL